MIKPIFDFCQELIVRTDIGSNMMQGDHKIITMCECKLAMAGGACKRGGKCIVARNPETYKLLTKKDELCRY